MKKITMLVLTALVSCNTLAFVDSDGGSGYWKCQAALYNDQNIVIFNESDKKVKLRYTYINKDNIIHKVTDKVNKGGKWKRVDVKDGLIWAKISFNNDNFECTYASSTKVENIVFVASYHGDLETRFPNVYHRMNDNGKNNNGKRACYYASLSDVVAVINEENNPTTPGDSVTVAFVDTSGNKNTTIKETHLAASEVNLIPVDLVGDRIGISKSGNNNYGARCDLRKAQIKKIKNKLMYIRFYEARRN